MGDYVINSHGVGEARAPYPDVREGYVVFGTVPYQVPLEVLVPEGAKNLLVPGALPVSHAGLGALRLEPIWTALGQAAGVAAELLLTDGAVSVGKLQAELHRRGAMTFYVSDVARMSPLWEMVQRVGNLGFFEEPVEGAAMVTGRPRFALQYAWAAEHHAARWRELPRRAGWAAPEALAGETRGCF